MKKRNLKSPKLAVATELVRVLSDATLQNVGGASDVGACSGWGMVSAIKARCGGNTAN